jgi:hypothetical protein
MKTLTLLVWLCLGATPAFAQQAAAIATPEPCSAAVGCGHVGAPAPLLGLGIPSALAVGGVLLGTKLFGRRRR